jgi:RNA polymerase sigma-70 factor (ECF subfamily)
LRRRAAAEERAVSKLSSGVPEAAGFAGQVLDDVDLHRALDRLPAAERDVIALRFGGALTVPEVAAALSEPLSRIEGRLYRGLRRLRDELDR